MDRIRDIVAAMDEKEVQEFRIFVQRNRFRKGRKDLALFENYITSPKATLEEQMRQLSIARKGAYYATRKRLYSHLEDYALLKSNAEDTSSASRVRGILSISDQLRSRGLFDLSWTMLERADVLAEEKGLYAQLEQTILKKIELTGKTGKAKVSELTSRYEQNRARLDQEHRLRILVARIRDEMNSSQSNDSVEIREELENLISETGLETELQQEPRIARLILNAIRANLNVAKDHSAYEDLAVSIYSGLKTDTAHEDKAEILYGLTHTRYRCGRLQEARSSLREMLSETGKCSKSYQKRVLVRNGNLNSAIDMLLGELNKGIRQLIALSEADMNSRDEATVNLNLTVYLFYASRYKEAKSNLLRMKRSDLWYAKTFGDRWLMRFKMIEVLNYIELDEVDLVESRLRSFERRFKDAIKDTLQFKFREYFNLVKEYIFHGVNSRFTEGVTDLKQSWDLLPDNERELHDTMFFAWLKSKTEERECYECLLNLLTP